MGRIIWMFMFEFDKFLFESSVWSVFSQSDIHMGKYMHF